MRCQPEAGGSDRDLDCTTKLQTYFTVRFVQFQEWGRELGGSFFKGPELLREKIYRYYHLVTSEEAPWYLYYPNFM